MKLTKIAVLSLALLLSTSMFAATASSGSMSLTHAVQLNGTQLKPGDYKITWEGTGPDVKVSVMQGKTVVATAPAHLREVEKSYSSNATLLQTNSDGSSALGGIRFGGKKVALDFVQETAAAGMKSGASSN